MPSESSSKGRRETPCEERSELFRMGNSSYTKGEVMAIIKRNKNGGGKRI